MQMTAEETQSVLNAISAATLPCIIFDLIVQAIHRWQRRRGGIVEGPTFGWPTRFFLSFFINASICAGFIYMYDLLWAGTGRAFLVGGFLWLMVSIPLLAMGRYQTDVQRGILAIRILGWLFKTGTAAASATYFLG